MCRLSACLGINFKCIGLRGIQQLRMHREVVDHVKATSAHSWTLVLQSPAFNRKAQVPIPWNGCCSQEHRKGNLAWKVQRPH